MSNIEQAIKNLKQRIERAAKSAGRDPNSIRLLAASKRTDNNGVIEAIQAGQLLFGENRAQSFRDKYNAIFPEHPQTEWHFIGHLQKNKIKYITQGKASMLHSLDSLNLAREINHRITRENCHPPPPALKVLVQIKFGNEENKTGLLSEDLFSFCDAINDFPNLELAGLMTIPPLYGTPTEWFQQLAQLAEKGRKEGFNLHELSMGMSGDLEEAIICGATIIRVGSAIFCT